MTTKQAKARSRNWKIYNLRALQASLHRLHPRRQEQIIHIIDEELKELGAFTYEQYRRRMR